MHGSMVLSSTFTPALDIKSTITTPKSWSINKAAWTLEIEGCSKATSHFYLLAPKVKQFLPSNVTDSINSLSFVTSKLIVGSLLRPSTKLNVESIH